MNKGRDRGQWCRDKKGELSGYKCASVAPFGICVCVPSHEAKEKSRDFLVFFKSGATIYETIFKTF